MNATELFEELSDRFANALDEDAYDITRDEDDGTIEVATDDWTLVIESWPAGIAYLALDDEPGTTDPDALRAEMTRLIGPAVAPLTTVNAASEGELGAALQRTRDPLSIALAGIIEAN